MTQFCKYLRFESKEQAVAILSPLFGTDDFGNLKTYRKNLGTLHIIGSISKKTGNTIKMYDTEVPEFKPLDGFHINALMEIENGLINSMSIDVTSPIYVFSN